MVRSVGTPQSEPPTVSPSRSWYLDKQRSRFQGEIKLADKTCVFTVIKSMSHQMSVTFAWVLRPGHCAGVLANDQFSVLELCTQGNKF